MYEPEAVCDRANNKGITQFNIFETDEVYSHGHFSLENTIKFPQKSQNNQKGYKQLIVYLEYVISMYFSQHIMTFEIFLT